MVVGCCENYCFFDVCCWFWFCVVFLSGFRGVFDGFICGGYCGDFVSYDGFYCVRRRR